MKTRIVNGYIKGNYTDQWIEDNQDQIINGDLVSDWDLAPLYEGNFVKPMWDGSSYYEGATNEEITEFNQQQLLKPVLEEKQRYVKRMKDGKDAYALQSAKLRLAKQSGLLDEASHNFIEEQLIPVRDEVVNGQWKSAREKLEAIGAETVGEQLYNELHTQIVDYISENY
jgi:hypothetical protein